MKNIFLCVTDNSAEILAVVNSDEDGKILKRALQLAASEIGEGRARSVIAIEILPMFKIYLDRSEMTQPVEVNQVFPSAFAASSALGLKGNGVAQGLKKAKDKGQSKAEVRGIVWQYVDDFASD